MPHLPPPIELLAHRVPAVAAAIHAVHHAAYDAERRLLGLAAFPPLDRTAADIAAEPDTFLGWPEGGRLAGVVSFVLSPAGLHGDDAPRPMLDIGRLVVHPDFARRGIGNALVAAAEAHVPPGGRVTVSTAEANTPAVRLYTARGYRVWQRRTLPDGLVLVRFLREMGG